MGLNWGFEKFFPLLLERPDQYHVGHLVIGRGVRALIIAMLQTMQCARSPGAARLVFTIIPPL